MDGQDAPRRTAGRSRRWIASAALAATGLVAGGILAGTHVAGAQDATTTPRTAPPGVVAPAMTGGSPGPGETLPTGATASKVEAVALEKVPDGTLIRVETDAGGSPYEAHIQKSDGTVVTVLIDEDFNVTETLDGFGPGPQQANRGMQPPSTGA
jgi:hypothetical protein